MNGPSPLADGAGELTDFVSAEDAPVLVKLLAAARPLSIQIHPPSDQAERNFAAQQADPSLPKLLADGLAKTEMLIAVRPFVLQGMREPQLAAAILRQVGVARRQALTSSRQETPKRQSGRYWKLIRPSSASSRPRSPRQPAPPGWIPLAWMRWRPSPLTTRAMPECLWPC